MAKGITFKVSAKDESSSVLESIIGKINSLGKSLGKQTAPLAKMSSALKSFSKMAPGIGVAMYAAGKLGDAVSKVGQALKDTEQAWAVSEKTFRRVDFAASLNKQLGATSQTIKDWAQSLSSEIGGWIDDEEFLDAMGDHIYDMSFDQLKNLTKAASDLSAATGKDLKTAFNELSNTLTGRVSISLKSSFSQLQNLTSEELAAGKAIEIVGSQVEGAAKAFSDTADGSIKAFASTVGDLKTELGAVFSESMTPMRNFFGELVGYWATVLRQKREYNEMEDRVYGGKGSSDDYGVIIGKLELEQKEVLATVQALEPQYQREKANKDNGLSFSRGVIDQYNSAIATLQDLNNEISRLIVEGTKKAREEEKAAEELANASNLIQSGAESQEKAGDYLLKAQKQELENSLANGTKTLADEDTFLELKKLSSEWYDLVAVRNANVGTELGDAVQRLINAMWSGWKQEYKNSQTTKDSVSYTGGSQSGLEYGEWFQDLSDNFNAISSSFSNIPALLENNLSSVGSSLLSGLSPLISGLQGILGAFIDGILGIDAIEALLNSVTILVEAFVDAFEPVVNSLLAPLIGFIAELGSLLGSVLIPIFNALEPIFTPMYDLLGSLLELLEPILALVASLAGVLAIITPVFGSVIDILTVVVQAIGWVIDWIYTGAYYIAKGIDYIVNSGINAINGLIDLLNNLPFVNISKLSASDLAGTLEDWYTNIYNATSLSSSGSSYLSSSSGTSSTYTGSGDTYVTIAYDHSYVNGDAREIALSLYQELVEAQALGY